MSGIFQNSHRLGFASGSIGGPIPYYCPRPRAGQLYYDLSGVTFLNNDPDGWQLNCYTDEILDSMLSLSRFTSLVRWDKVTDDFRPTRATPLRRVYLFDSATYAELSQNEWLWTAASDGRVAVGWIVRNFNYGANRWDSGAVPYVADATHPWPAIAITGLDDTGPHELVWFDDHRGKIIDRMEFAGYNLLVDLPNTEGGGGFGKSLAFLIQPVGDTPDRVFSELPDEPIGQILIDTTAGGDPIDLPSGWNEEWVTLYRYVNYAFVATTKPSIDPASYYYEWDFGPLAGTRYAKGQARNRVESVFFYLGNVGDYTEVKVDIKDGSGNRISGDSIHVCLPNI